MDTVTRTSFLWYLDCWRESHQSCLCSPMVLFPSPGILRSLMPILLLFFSPDSAGLSCLI